MIESGQDADALSLVGQAWDVWLSATSSASPTSSISLTSDESTSKGQNGRLCPEEPVVSTMPHKKALCYGFCPTQDEFFLLRCKDCGLLVKPIAYRHHQNTRHAVRRMSQDMHDREPNCSSRIRNDSGPTPGLSVFSPDSCSQAPDDFDGILLSPVAAHPTSATPEGARLRRDSQPDSPQTICPSQETRTRPIAAPDAPRRKPPPNRPKKTLRTIMPVKAASLKNLPVAADPDEPETYYVKQHGDLVMKFSKNVTQPPNNRSDIRVENRKSRSRRKQELTVSPSPNGKGSNVIKSIDLVTPPCTPDRLKADIAAGARPHPPDILRTTSCATIHSTKVEPLEPVVLDEEWSSSSTGLEYIHDTNNNKHPKPQSSGACIVRLHARAPPFAAAYLPAFDRRIDRLRTGLQKTVRAPIAQPLSSRGSSLEPSDVRFVDSNAAQKRETSSLRQLLTSRTAAVDYPPAATPRITPRIVQDIPPPQPRRQPVLMTAATPGAATHNYAKASVAPSSIPPAPLQQQQQLTLAMHPPQQMTASSSTVMQQQWNRQQSNTGATPTPPMTPSPGVSNKPQQHQQQHQQQLHQVVATTSGSFAVHHQPLMAAQHLMQHAAAYQKPKKRPALTGGPQRKRPRGAQQRPPALILPPNATFAQVTSNNMGQWRKLSAKATHHTSVGSLPPGTTVLALPAQSQIAGLVESGQLKLLPINGQTSGNGTTAFILPNKNGVVALGRAAVGGRSQPVSVKSLSIESSLGQQPVFVNLQTATHRAGALHVGHGQTSCTLVQSGPNATIYRLPLSQSGGAGYSSVHQTTLQSPVAIETVHST